MANVGYLAAGILFETELYEPDFLMLKLYFTLHPDDTCALKTSRNASVKILLAGYMDLPDDVQFR